MVYKINIFYCYRKNAWKGSKPAIRSEEEAVAKTWSPAIFNAYFDVLVVVLVFSIICLDCFLSYRYSAFRLEVAQSAAGLDLAFSAFLHFTYYVPK